jgi:hypothetical protein
MPGEDMTLAQVVAPVANQLIRFEGHPASGRFVANLHFQGFAFRHTDWSMPATGYGDVQAAYDVPAAIDGVGAVSIAIENCSFAQLGQYAVSLGRGSKNNRIVANEMADLGAGGVKIGDTQIPVRESESSTGNVISDNRIHDIGIVYPGAVGVWVGQSGGNTIAHNDIHDTFYTGISIGWTWGYGQTAARGNVIEFNHIQGIGRGMLSDMGGIYTLGVQPGTVIRNNLFHDITSYG